MRASTVYMMTAAFEKRRAGRIIQPPALSRVEHRSERNRPVRQAGGQSGNQDNSEAFEKGHQLWGGFPFSWRGRCQARPFPEKIQRFPFHVKVRGDVTARRADRGMAEVIANYRNVNTSLQ